MRKLILLTTLLFAGSSLFAAAFVKDDISIAQSRDGSGSVVEYPEFSTGDKYGLAPTNVALRVDHHCEATDWGKRVPFESICIKRLRLLRQNAGSFMLLCLFDVYLPVEGICIK